MISYTNMKLKVSNKKNILKWNDQEIEVLDYLPIEDKYDLIMITLQKSYEEGYFNPIKLDKYFHLHLIYMYTNINFTDKQKEDESKLYDTLKSNGFIDEFLITLKDTEYNDLYTWLEETKKAMLDSKRNITQLVQNLINDLPKQAEAMKKIMDDFDSEKYQNVINFAKAANGNRDIK